MTFGSCSLLFCAGGTDWPAVQSLYGRPVVTACHAIRDPVQSSVRVVWSGAIYAERYLAPRGNRTDRLERSGRLRKHTRETVSSTFPSSRPRPTARSPSESLAIDSQCVSKIDTSVNLGGSSACSACRENCGSDGCSQPISLLPANDSVTSYSYPTAHRRWSRARRSPRRPILGGVLNPP